MTKRGRKEERVKEKKRKRRRRGERRGKRRRKRITKKRREQKMGRSRETSSPINAPRSTIELSILLFRSFKHGTRKEGENELENAKTRVLHG